MDISVPWNASWAGEARLEIRPCKYAGGELAVWQKTAQGVGRPIFTKPHFVRQRISIARYVCTVCGEHAPAEDRWWFALGAYRGEWFMTTEAPVHKKCAEHALQVCPHLKLKNAGENLSRFPVGARVIASIVGGEKFEKDFGLRLNGRTVVGALKFAWPRAHVRIIERDAS